MESASPSRRSLVRQAMFLEGATITYNLAEGVIPIVAGLHAGIQPERISHAPPFQDRWQFDWSLKGVAHSQVAWIRSSAACSANGLVIFKFADLARRTAQAWT